MASFGAPSARVSLRETVSEIALVNWYKLLWHVVVEGTLTFASVPKLMTELSKLPAASTVYIDLAVDFIDHAAFESLHSWRLNHEKTGGKVRVEEVQEEWYKPAAEGRPRRGREA